MASDQAFLRSKNHPWRYVVDLCPHFCPPLTETRSISMPVLPGKCGAGWNWRSVNAPRCQLIASAVAGTTEFRSSRCWASVRDGDERGTPKNLLWESGMPLLDLQPGDPPPRVYTSCGGGWALAAGCRLPRSWPRRVPIGCDVFVTDSACGEQAPGEVGVVGCGATFLATNCCPVVPEMPLRCRLTPVRPGTTHRHADGRSTD